MLWIKLLTWFKGELVGQDSYGNRYYRKKGPESLHERRWVLYKGCPEASKVPAEWHGWLHHRRETPMPIGKIQRWPWEKNHLPNLSGTSYAYRPAKQALPTGTYQAWHPQEGNK